MPKTRASRGWSIADTRYWSTTTFGTWTSSTNLLKISIQGDVTTSTSSTDATLSDLVLQDTSDDSAITLDPVFATGTTSYTASVDNDVSQILVDPTTTDDGATVAYFDADDTAIDDANTMEDGHQVALAVGANTIKVKVTAEDTTSEETYTVEVTRAAATTETEALVSNTDWARDGVESVGDAGSGVFTQRFTTGTHNAPYTVSSVGIHVHTDNLDAGESVTVQIHEFDTTETNNVGTLIATLTTPTSLVTSDMNDLPHPPEHTEGAPSTC